MDKSESCNSAIREGIGKTAVFSGWIPDGFCAKIDIGICQIMKNGRFSF